MENMEKDKWRYDLERSKKAKDELTLKLQRVENQLNKLMETESEVEKLKTYYSNLHRTEQARDNKLKEIEEKDQRELLGLLKHKNKKPSLFLIEYLDLEDLITISSLNKNYRGALMTHESFLWRFAYRETIITTRLNEKDLLQSLRDTEQELKSIVPLKESDALIGLEQFDINVQKLLQNYQERRVGLSIEPTMLQAKNFIASEFSFMQKQYQKDKE